MFGREDGAGGLEPASMELVRLALPRRVYTQSHVDRVIEIAAKVAGRAKELRGLRMIYRPRFLPHFTAKFEPDA
jgi:tryptophanase